MSRKLTDAVAEHIEEGFDLHGMGEELWWDLTATAMQTPSGAMPVVMFFVYAKSPLLGGNPITATITSGVPIKLLDRDNVIGMVKQGVETVLAERSKILAGGNGS